MSLNPPSTALPSELSPDKLTIETPEQTTLDFAVAGIGSRFLAIAYDLLIQTVVGIIVGIGGAFALGGISAVAPKAAIWGGALLIIFYFLLYFGYFPFFEILWNGQTPGKRKIGIRVIKDSGRPLTPAESIGRNLMRIVDWLPFLYGVGIVSAFLTDGNKRLGDLLVGSLVVRETSLKELTPIWHAAPLPGAGASLSTGPLGAYRLSPEECALIESFLSRRSSLDYDVRRRMAEEVYRKIKDRLTLSADTTLSAERVLEGLSYERRATGHFS
ncbi:MAG TPA: RDD family protein [Candidatus Dormibacteraeota bacterium]|nr:RDD family protein [Candidatus Dormibacteraeota bacterium]